MRYMYGEVGIIQILPKSFGSSRHHKREKWHNRIPEEILSQKMYFQCKNIEIKTWPSLTLALTLPPTKVKLNDVIESNDYH